MGTEGDRELSKRELRGMKDTPPRYPLTSPSPFHRGVSHSGSECRLSHSDDAFWAYFLHSSRAEKRSFLFSLSLVLFPCTTVHAPPQRAKLALQFGAFNFLAKAKSLCFPSFLSPILRSSHSKLAHGVSVNCRFY